MSADVGLSYRLQTQSVSLQQVTNSTSWKQMSTAAPISAEGSTVKFSEEDSKDLGQEILTRVFLVILQYSTKDQTLSPKNLKRQCCFCTWAGDRQG